MLSVVPLHLLLFLGVSLAVSSAEVGLTCTHLLQCNSLEKLKRLVDENGLQTRESAESKKKALEAEKLGVKEHVMRFKEATRV